MTYLSLRRSLSVTCQFSEWYTCIDRLRASEAGAPDELREFAQIALDEAAIFCWQGDVFERDGEALVLVACRFKGFDWLLNKYVATPEIVNTLLDGPA